MIQDVSRYYEFVPFCTSSRILSSEVVQAKYDPLYTESGSTFYAEMAAGFYKLTDSYVSKVTVCHLKSIEAEAVDTAMFRYLRTKWSFQDLGSGKCRIEFFIEFEFMSHIYAYMANFAFLELAKATIRAFENRCTELLADENCNYYTN